jgi:hypothetical protein
VRPREDVLAVISAWRSCAWPLSAFWDSRLQTPNISYMTRSWGCDFWVVIPRRFLWFWTNISGSYIRSIFRVQWVLTHWTLKMVPKRSLRTKKMRRRIATQNHNLILQTPAEASNHTLKKLLNHTLCSIWICYKISVRSLLILPSSISNLSNIIQPV